MQRILRISVVVLTILFSSAACYGYTVLTHEAIIDSVWDTSLKRVLLQRFPKATAEELQQAHAYAYGGCIIQDMGYYPFGNRFFTDLTHYVRSGDFISALIRESHDLNEYAFALGALEHYAADSEGHRIATNRAVAIIYPKLRREFGADVTYWDNPSAHIRTELAFDAIQVARGRYASDSYRNFIGFEVSKDLLERAFADTYSIEMKDIFPSLSLALGTYRHAVSSVIPGMTKVAWELRKDDIQKEIPGITRTRFLYNLSRSSYEKEWGTEYQKPGWRVKVMALFLRIVPKVGPFKALKISAPTPEVEKLFMTSFNATVDRYKTMLADLNSGRRQIANVNLDEGEPTRVGRYQGADEAYAKLVGKLADRQFAGMKPDLRQNILAYYKDMSPSVPASATRKGDVDFQKLKVQLDRLRR